MKVRNKTMMPIIALLFSIILEVPAREIGQGKKKRNPNWKKIKTYYLQMIYYI